MARLYIAQIHLTRAGIRVPYSSVAVEEKVAMVSLIVLVEPLVLGVLPMSVIPVIWTWLGVLGVGTCGVLPWVWRTVEDAARRARSELEVEDKDKEKKAS
jgi:hypothetical protein